LRGFRGLFPTTFTLFRSFSPQKLFITFLGTSISGRLPFAAKLFFLAPPFFSTVFVMFFLQRIKPSPRRRRFSLFLVGRFLSLPLMWPFSRIPPNFSRWLFFQKRVVHFSILYPPLFVGPRRFRLTNSVRSFPPLPSLSFLVLLFFIRLCKVPPMIFLFSNTFCAPPIVTNVFPQIVPDSHLSGSLCSPLSPSTGTPSFEIRLPRIYLAVI